MELVIDFLLLAASGTAGLYCWVLSKKLKAMTEAEAGLGAGIAALSQSAEEVKSAVAAAKTSADETETRIRFLLSEADDKAVQLRKLIDQLGDMSASVADHAENATKKYLETLTPFLDEANETADRLLNAIAEAPSPAQNDKPAPAARAKRAKSAKAAPAEAPASEGGDYFDIDEKDAENEQGVRAGAAA